MSKKARNGEDAAGGSAGAVGDAADMGALSDWLVSHLKVTRAEALEQAASVTAAPPLPEAVEPEAVEPVEPEAVEPEAVEPEAVEPGAVEPIEPQPSMDTEEDPPPPVLDTQEGPTTLEPQVFEADLDEAYAALAFLRPEERRRRAARRKRIGLLLFAAVLLGSGWVVFSRSPEPSAPAASVAPEVSLPRPAPVEVPSRVVVLESHLIEVPVEEKPGTHDVTPGTAALAPDPDTTGIGSRSAFDALRGGRAVARYPDLPHATLIDLEKATERRDVTYGRK